MHCASEAWDGLRRNPGLSLLSAASIGVSLYVLGLFLLLAWALVRGVQLYFAGPGFGHDPFEYLSYARAWGQGAAPYRDFHPEYPPGALLLFMPPYLAGGPAYVNPFVAEMALFDACTLGLVFAFARRLWPQSTPRHVAAAGGYLVATALLQPLLYWRFDLAPTALTLGALFLAGTPWSAAGALLLGVSASMKVWPLALLPLWLAPAYRQRSWRAAVVPGACAAAGLLLPMPFFILRANTGMLEFLRFQSERGLQLESCWANLALLLDAVGASRASITYHHGAFHVQGGATPLLQAVARPAIVALTFAPQLIAHARGALTPPGSATRGWVDASAASLLGLLVGSSVLSPQFMIWLVPLLVLVDARGIAVAVLVAALTTALYPVLYNPFVTRQAPLYGLALSCLSARNFLLAAAYAALIVRLLRNAPAAKADTVPSSG